MSKPILCRFCGDEVVFGQLLPTGAICVDCGGVATPTLEPQAPTNDPNEGGETMSVSLPPANDGADNSAPDAPRAAEEQTESNGEPAPRAAGDRADGFVDVAHLRPFDQPETRQVPSIVVEEWIYGFIVGQDSAVVLRTPREIYPGLAAEMLERLGEFCRFVVVMEWQQYAGQNVDLRDIGPSFTPRGSTAADRAAALNTAKAWANGQCRRMRLAFPTIFRAARELPTPIHVQETTDARVQSDEPRD